MASSEIDSTLIQQLENFHVRSSLPTKKKFNPRKAGPRDSLNRRNRMGKPGSKRYQRWLNRSYLLELETDFDMLEFEIVPESSLFGFLFENEEQLKIWGDFCEYSEEEQRMMLASIEKEEKAKNTPCTPYASWIRNVDISLRKLIRKHWETDFLKTLDEEIYQLVEMPEHILTYNFDAFHRMLCYALCQFYSLRSMKKVKNSEKLVIVDNPHPQQNIKTPLTQFLNSILKT